MSQNQRLRVNTKRLGGSGWPLTDHKDMSMPEPGSDSVTDKNVKKAAETGDTSTPPITPEWKPADNEAVRRNGSSAAGADSSALPKTTIVQDSTGDRSAQVEAPRAVSSWSVAELPDTLRYLETLRGPAEAALRGSTGGERAQRNAYELLQSKHIFPELLAEKRIGPGWKIFPTMQQSPTDKAGGDYLLVNTETGAFHFLDATERADKISNPKAHNVFDLRLNGIIVVDRTLFDQSGALKIDADDPRSQKALEFKESLKTQIADLANSETPFRLGKDGTPMPSVKEVQGDDKIQAEVEKLVRWAREQERIAEPGKKALFANMAEIVSRGATHSEIKQLEVASPKFVESIRRVTENEITRYTFAEYEAKFKKGSGYKPSSSAPADNHVYVLKDGSLRLRAENNERHIGGNFGEHLEKGWMALNNTKKLLGSLTDSELKKMGADVSKFKGLQGEERATAIEKAFNADSKLKTELARLRSVLSDNRGVITSGGSKGNGPAAIAENILKKLNGRSEDILLGKEEAKPSAAVAAAPKETAAEKMAKEAPSAYNELAKTRQPGMLELNVANADVRETMELLMMDQESKKTWPDGQLEKFKAQFDAYKDPSHPKHLESVKQLNEWLNEQSKRESHNDNNRDASNVVEIQRQLKGNPTFEKLTDNARMKEAVTQLFERASSRMPKTNNNERGEFLSGQLKSTFRKQLGVNTDSALPENLKNLQVRVVDGDVKGVRTVQDKSGQLAIEVPAALLKQSAGKAISDLYSQASGLSMINLLDASENKAIMMRSLKPMMDDISLRTAKVLAELPGADSTLAAKPNAERAASDQRPAVETQKTLVTSWDGENLAFGNEKFHLKSEVAKIALENQEKVKDLEKQYTEAQKLADQTKKDADRARAQLLQEQLTAERQNLQVVSELREAMNGQRGLVAQEKASTLVKTAADRVIAEHLVRPRAGGSSMSLSRGTAMALVVTTLASLYLGSPTPARAHEYEGGFK